MRRFAQHLSAALLGIVALGIALGWVATNIEVAEEPQAGGTYTEGIAGHPSILNPILARDDTSRTVSSLIFAGLTRSTEDGRFVPDLAERWEVDEQRRSFTFSLHPKARWHDGEPVTSADVIFTVRAIQDREYRGPLASSWKGIAVQAVDELTVRFLVNDRPLATLPELSSVGLLPEHLLRNVPATQLGSHSFNSRPVGSGPFRLMESGRDFLRLAAYPMYHGTAPQLEHIVFKVFSSYGSALTALARGEVDGVPAVSPGDIGRARELPNVLLYEGVWASTAMLFLNVARPPFDDVRVRQAAAFAVKRADLVEQARLGQARLADSPVLPESWALAKGKHALGHDPERASRLLQNAGWTLPSGGRFGVRLNAMGEALRIELLTGDQEEQVQLAQLLGDQLRAVGFEVELQALGIGGLVQDFLRPRRYQAALFSWEFAGLDPDVYSLWHSEAIKDGTNIVGLADPAID